MAERPLFVPSLEGDSLVEIINIEFEWFPGFSASQKQESIMSLHKAAKKSAKVKRILEISTKSLEEVGVRASAFNLNLRLKNSAHSSVESFYQGSKVFKKGGPYLDLYDKNSFESKKDERLKSSGDLTGFIFQGKRWEISDHFYDWLYLNALIQDDEIAEKIIEYDGYTDIEFNPKKSFNCQAHTAALFKALKIRNVDLNKIKNPSRFVKLFHKENLPFSQYDLFL